MKTTITIVLSVLALIGCVPPVDTTERDAFLNEQIVDLQTQIDDLRELAGDDKDSSEPALFYSVNESGEPGYLRPLALEAVKETGAAHLEMIYNGKAVKVGNPDREVRFEARHRYVTERPWLQTASLMLDVENWAHRNLYGEILDDFGRLLPAWQPSAIVGNRVVSSGTRDWWIQELETVGVFAYLWSPTDNADLAMPVAHIKQRWPDKRVIVLVTPNYSQVPTPTIPPIEDQRRVVRGVLDAGADALCVWSKTPDEHDAALAELLRLCAEELNR